MPSTVGILSRSCYWYYGDWAVVKNGAPGSTVNDYGLWDFRESLLTKREMWNYESIAHVGVRSEARTIEI